ncbi:MAG: helix-turn-helix domain-containing protein [Candidatus Riflebacteria bacterium]|nr:helix-turn-helix domain-containing protein [Candidatus Riflebacteria bacterium]
MKATEKKQVVSAWTCLQKHIPLHPITCNEEYERAEEALNELIDTVGNDERHPLSDLLHVLGGFIREYEDAHIEMPKATGVSCIQFLMEQHDLKQSDLADLLGGQSIVSAILAGKRKLNIRQIRQLSDHFHVSPSTFF